MTLLKPRVLRFESLPSTNTELARLASDGAEEGLSIVAEEQTAGRGRLQRTVSQKGAGLYSASFPAAIPRIAGHCYVYGSACRQRRFAGSGRSWNDIMAHVFFR